jgi:S-adenosylmethionine decarboxylase
LHSLLDLVLIDLYDCDHRRLLDADGIRAGMIHAAELMGADVVGSSFHTFEPWGVSGTVTIAESHLAVHTWPEYNFAAVTFETCGTRMNHRKAFDFLVDFFGAKNPQITFHKRGFMRTAEAALKYKQVVG